MNRLSRRSFVRGLSVGAGALVLGPLLRQSLALAEGQTPRRIVILMEGDSLRTSAFMPPETLAALTAARGGSSTEAKSGHYTNDKPLVTTGLTLPRTLEGLAAYADRMNLVFGLSNKIAAGSHSADYGALSCARAPRGVAGGPTVDYVLGQRLGAQSVFNRLALGVVSRPDRDVVYSSSAAAAQRPLPVFVNPLTAHQMLFGSVSGGESRVEFDQRTHLFDSLAADYRSIHGGLRGAVRESFEGYATSLEMLRDRQSKLLAMQGALSARQPDVTADIYTAACPLVRLEAQCDLAAASLAAGLTNVVLLTSGCGNFFFSMNYPSVDATLPQKHGLGHGESHLGKGNRYWLNEIHHRHSMCIARLIQRLEAVPEAGGTAFDNTLIVYMADGGEKHHSNFDEWPAVLISGKNIPIRTAQGGRSVIYPKLGASGHRQLSNLYNTLFHAMGKPEDAFGEEGTYRVAKGPLPELLT
jgi:hypothetical protein